MKLSGNAYLQPPQRLRIFSILPSCCGASGSAYRLFNARKRGAVCNRTIAQAGGDPVKGGSRVKGGSLTQEQVAQEDVPLPYSLSVKTPDAYGTRTGNAEDRIRGTASKTAPAPALHHTVKTVADRPSKVQPRPGLHHTVPVVRDEPATDSRGIKTLKTKTRFSQVDTQVRDLGARPVVPTVKTTEKPSAQTLKTSAAGKTSFSSQDSQVRDPIARPIVQTVKTVQVPVVETRNVKTLKTATTGKTRFSRQDTQVRDPIARPVVQTVQDPVVETLKTATRGKTRFSQQDTQVRDPIARPVVQTVKTVEDPVVETRNVKTLKTATTGKTRFSQQDTQVRDPVVQTVQSTEDPTTDAVKTLKTLTVVQTVKTVEEPSVVLNHQTVKTVTKTAETSNRRTKTAVKTSQEKIDSSRVSNIPQSIVETARRNTLRTVIPPERASTGFERSSGSENRQNIQLISNSRSQITPDFGIANEKGEIILDAEAITLLQNAGGVIKESGEITLNDDAIGVLQNVRGSSFDPSSPVFRRTSNEDAFPGGQILEHSRQLVSSQANTGVAEGDQILRFGDTFPGGRANPERSEIYRHSTETNYRSNQNFPIRGSVGTRGATPGTQRGGGTAAGLRRSQEGGSINTDPGLRNQGNINAVRGSSRLISSERRTTAQNTGIHTGVILSNDFSLAGNKEVTMFDNLNIRGDTISQRTPGLTSEQLHRSRRPKPITHGSGTLSTRGTIRNQHRTANIPENKIRARPAAESPVVFSGEHQTIVSRGTLRSQGITDGRQQVITPNVDSVLFNGQEISVSGLQEGQLFDENLRPILSGTPEGAKADVVRTSVINQNIKPESLRELTRGTDAVNVPKEKVKPGARARSPATLPGQPNVQTSVYRGPFRSQDIRQSTTLTNAETVFFNGREISISGLKEGQLFDENLQPLSSYKPGSAKPEDFRASITPQDIKQVSLRRQGASASAVSSNYGSSTVLTRRRQQAVSASRDKVKLRTPARSPTKSSDQLNVQTSTVGGPSKSQDARQSTTSGNAETVIFNGREISITGLKEGQLFDENLQPLSSDKPGSAKPEDFRASTTPHDIKPVSLGARGVAVSAVSSTYGASTVLTRRRQQAVSAPRDKVKLRTPARSPTKFSDQLNVQTSTVGGPLISQDVRQSTAAGNEETVVFNGREISISGLKEGQLFDENLQPVLADKTENARPADVRASGIPQSIKPVLGTTLPKYTSRQRGRKPSTGSSQILSTSERGLLSNKQFEISSGAVRSTSRVRPTPDVNARTVIKDTSQIPKSRGRVTEYTRQQTSAAFGSRSSVDSRSQQLPRSGISRTSVISHETPSDTGKPFDSAAARTVVFNGKEINIDGLKAGQLFDENLQPISSGISDAPKRGDTEKSAVQHPRSPVGVLRRTSQGSVANIPNTRQVPSSGILTNTGITSSQRSSSTGLRRSELPQGTPTLRLRSRTSAQTTIRGTQESSVRASSQSGTRLQSGTLTAGVKPSISRTSGARVSGAGFRTDALAPQQSPTDSRRKASQLSPGAISSGGAELRASGSPAVGSLITYGVRNQQLVAKQRTELRTSAAYPITHSGQGVADANKPITGSNADTIFFNGKEISIGGLREGQLFDENLQPILPDNVESAKIDDVKSFIIPQSVRPTGSQGTSVSSTYGSGITSHGVRQRQRQSANIAKDKLKLRTSSELPITASGQPNTQTGISRATLRSQGSTHIRQPNAGTAEDTVIFNGKEINISGLREGQIFDENLQPIVSDNTGSVSIEDVKISPIPQNPKPASLPGIRSQAIPGDSRNPEFTLSALSSTGGYGRRGSSTARGSIPEAQPKRLSAASTRRSGGSTVPGLRSQSVSRQSQRTPDLRSAISPEGISSSTGNSGSPQNTASRSSQAADIRPSDFRSYTDASSSRGSRVSSRASSSSRRRAGFTDQSGVSRATQNTPGILQFNSGDVSSKYASESASRRLHSPGRISQDRITQEIAQDRIETPIVQQNRETPIVPQYTIDTTQQNIQATLESTETKQTQLKTVDVFEQSSSTKPEALKTVQVQETIPFSVPESSPKTTSKTTFTRVSQVSQKDIDIPTVQQQLLTGGFEGYLPKASFLPPFNYGLPQLKYGVQAPIAQEQQKVEQVFV